MGSVSVGQVSHPSLHYVNNLSLGSEGGEGVGARTCNLEQAKRKCVASCISQVIADNEGGSSRPTES